jgi:hypothetical protein
MLLLLLESLGAGLIFIGIIWWTMFSGRTHGELPNDPEALPDALSERPGTPSAEPENLSKK